MSKNLLPLLIAGALILTERARDHLHEHQESRFTEARCDATRSSDEQEGPTPRRSVRPRLTDTGCASVIARTSGQAPACDRRGNEQSRASTKHHGELTPDTSDFIAGTARQPVSPCLRQPLRFSCPPHGSERPSLFHNGNCIDLSFRLLLSCGALESGRACCAGLAHRARDESSMRPANASDTLPFGARGRGDGDRAG